MVELQNGINKIVFVVADKMVDSGDLLLYFQRMPPPDCVFVFIVSDKRSESTVATYL